MSTDFSRRKMLKSACVALAVMPLTFIAKQTLASTNATLRLQFKYKNTPQETMSCISCLEFIPGKTDKDLGGCKVMPGDDEISPNGYCSRWNTM